MVVAYRTDRITYAIARRVVKIPFIGLVNVVAGREVAREFVQDALQPAAVARCARAAARREAVRRAQHDRAARARARACSGRRAPPAASRRSRSRSRCDSRGNAHELANGACAGRCALGAALTARCSPRRGACDSHNDRAVACTREQPTRRVIFSLWHGELLPLLWQHRGENVAIVISEHKDGEIIAQHRRVTRLLDGARIVVEGWQSRAHRVDARDRRRTRRRDHAGRPARAGARLRARRCGRCAANRSATSCPIRAAASSAWRLKSWDRFLIPKPFARVDVSYGQLTASSKHASPREAAEQAPTTSGVCSMQRRDRDALSAIDDVWYGDERGGACRARSLWHRRVVAVSRGVSRDARRAVRPRRLRSTHPRFLH